MKHLGNLIFKALPLSALLFGTLVFASAVQAQSLAGSVTESVSDIVSVLAPNKDDETATSDTQPESKFGIASLELSPVRIALSGGDDDAFTMSGTVIFSVSDPTVEIAVPFLWSNMDEENDFDPLILSTKALAIDVQWRKFDEPTRNGGYVGVLARAFAGRSKGTNNENFDNPFGFVGNDSFSSSEDATLLGNHSEADFGLGVVAGFRRRISSGFYWGANISLVAMLKGPDNDDQDFGFDEHDFFRERVNVTFDFLKIGYQF